LSKPPQKAGVPPVSAFQRPAGRRRRLTPFPAVPGAKSLQSREWEADIRRVFSHPIILDAST